MREEYVSCHREKRENVITGVRSGVFSDRGSRDCMGKIIRLTSKLARYRIGLSFL